LVMLFFNAKAPLSLAERTFAYCPPPPPSAPSIPLSPTLSSPALLSLSFLPFLSTSFLPTVRARASEDLTNTKHPPTHNAHTHTRRSKCGANH
jgi:hypothetical protein